MKPILIVSFSSGESSAFMAQWLKKNKQEEYEMLFIMANTGEENEESLIFANQCDEYFGLGLIWVECITNPIHGQGVKARVVDYKTASRNGEPFEAMIQKHGIPNINSPHCSRELKEHTINSYIRSLGIKERYTAIGYRVDEIDRMNEKWKEKKHIYPLIFNKYQPMTKPAINRFWREMPFRLTIKGYEDNCKVCWKKSLRKLLTLAKYHPERFTNFAAWEKKYEYYVPDTRKHNTKQNPPFRFFRGNLSVSQIIEMSKMPFEEAVDDRQKFIEYKQTELLGFELDIANGCNESCEAFK